VTAPSFPARPFGAIETRIAVEDERWERALPPFETLIGSALDAVARRAGLAPGTATELGLTLADDAASQALNREWRGRDRPTNVLSFPIRALRPGDAPGPMLGDLVLALETLEREAAGEGKSLADHFLHLVVHGALHCLGHDHEGEREAERMEALERLVLADLGVADPYRESEPEAESVGA
jgi:probable rRNA maturation factor